MAKPEDSLQFDGLVFVAAEELEHEIDDIETQNQVRNLLNSQLERFDDDEEEEDTYHDGDDADYHEIGRDDDRGQWNDNEFVNDNEQYNYEQFDQAPVDYKEPVYVDRPQNYVPVSLGQQEVDDFESYGQEVVALSPYAKSPFHSSEHLDAVLPHLTDEWSAARGNEDYIVSLNPESSTNQGFFTDQGSDSTELLDQLKILYEARGRQIDELTEKHSTLQQQSNRAARICEHKVRLVQEEKAEIYNKLEVTQQKLETEIRLRTETENQLNSLRQQISTLQSVKEELLLKLGEAENSVIDLNSQFNNLLSARTESTQKFENEAMIKSLEEKHKNEIFLWKQKFDDANNELEAKKEQVAVLKYQLSEVKDQVTGSNNEQSHHLTPEGRKDDMTKLKMKLEDAIASKSITEDINTSLQAEIKELKEQIVMYETASRHGISTVRPPSGVLADHQRNVDLMNDSYAQLGIKSVDQASNEPAHGLKAELERCLLIYRNKRQQVTLLTEELKHTKSQLIEAKAHLELYKVSAEKDQATRDMHSTMDSRDQTPYSSKRVHFGDSSNMLTLQTSGNENLNQSVEVPEKLQPDAIIITPHNLEKLSKVVTMIEEENNNMNATAHYDFWQYGNNSKNDQMIHRYTEMIRSLEIKSLVTPELSQIMTRLLLSLRQLWIKNDLPAEYRKWEETVLSQKLSEWKKVIIQEEQLRWEQSVLPQEQERWEHMVLSQERLRWEQVVLPQERTMWESKIQSQLQTKWEEEVLPREREKWEKEITPQLHAKVVEEVLTQEQNKWKSEILPQEKTKWEHEVLPQHRAKWEQVIVSREHAKFQQEILPKQRVKWSEEIIPIERRKWEQEVLPEECKKWKKTVLPQECDKWFEELLKERNKWNSEVLNKEKVKLETEILSREKAKWENEILPKERAKWELEVLPKERAKWNEEVLSKERAKWYEEILPQERTKWELDILPKEKSRWKEEVLCEERLRWEQDVLPQERVKWEEANRQSGCVRCQQMPLSGLQQLIDHDPVEEDRQKNDANQAEMNEAALFALQEIKNKYLHTVKLIKDEVLRHVAETNKRNADMLKHRLLHERQTTARYMRNHYIKCLTQFLDKQFDSVFRDRMLAAMEKLMDNMPERDCNSLPIFSFNHQTNS